ncbi:MAG TPA: hypothetical protein VNI82_00610 [Candidatus Nitrosotenuis sp.]|nr:hypothetical protein [Candidatus Nitrosotenuis sp.]
MIRPKQKTLIIGAMLASVLVASPVVARGAPEDTGRERALAQQTTVQERKQEIKDRVTTMREEVKVKLTDKRLQACEARQEKINAIVSRSTAQSTKHLGVFQKIEERVTDFYASKNLSADNYDSLLATVEEKESAAVAAIAVAKETKFDCATTDGDKPGSVIKDLMRTQHQALKDYRTAIKDLMVGVKTSLESNDKETTKPEEQDVTQEEPQV